MSNGKICILPYPKKLEIFRNETLVLNRGTQILIQNDDAGDLYKVKETLSKVLRGLQIINELGESDVNKTLIIFNKNAKLPAEGYTLNIRKKDILIEYSQAPGAYYAVKTLTQIMVQYGSELPGLSIEDAPDFPSRGVMLDIGRDKIPTMDSLFQLIDMLSDLKINQLQLYMEGYSFEYEPFKELFPDETPITAEEFQMLDAYAREQFIQLVPTQNCFGHMAPWLATEKFRDLAEKTEGIEIMPGFKFPSSTLNPLDERSERLVGNLLNELLPNFCSSYVNICMDEPFELGTGKSAQACAEKGVGQVYLDFLNKVCRIVRKYGRIPMAWGDIITSHPEMLSLLPKDLIVLDWNYEGMLSFEDHCRLLKENGISFYVCPGTSSWGSIAGRTSNMKVNILNAAEQGHKYGAEGILFTDWGDMGHWQYTLVSYPGYVYGASVAWNTDGNRDVDIARYLNGFIFKDTSCIMGGLVLELGDYSKYEGVFLPNFTLTFCVLTLLGLCSKQELVEKIEGLMSMVRKMTGNSFWEDFKLAFDYVNITALLKASSEKLERVQMSCRDANLVTDELENTIRLLGHGADLIYFIEHEHEMDYDIKQAKIKNLSDGLSEIIDIYTRLWKARNREGGLERSIRQFFVLKKQYSDKLNQLKTDGGK